MYFLELPVIKFFKDQVHYEQDCGYYVLIDMKYKKYEHLINWVDVNTKFETKKLLDSEISSKFIYDETEITSPFYELTYYSYDEFSKYDIGEVIILYFVTSDKKEYAKLKLLI